MKIRRLSLTAVLGALFTSVLSGPISSSAQTSVPTVPGSETSAPPVGKQKTGGKGGEGGAPSKDTAAGSTAMAMTVGSPDSTGGAFGIGAFDTDLFRGAAVTGIPIRVPAGAAGVAPKIVLRYDSGGVDALGSREQGSIVGLGWTLDVGGFIARDMKDTPATSDDRFVLVFGGAAHELVAIDGAGTYHTKDDLLYKVTYVASGNYWVLTTQDGTQHRFGFADNSRGRTVTRDTTTELVGTYFLDEVKTPSGVAITYTYTKDSVTMPVGGKTYDRSVRPDRISWSRKNGALIGSERYVTFTYEDRLDWADTSGPATTAFFSTKHLATIDVHVAGESPSLVRKYVLGKDYLTIDRDPDHVWPGGAAKDLALRTLTMTAEDGTSTLPPLTFGYDPVGRLTSVTNGIGGSVSYGWAIVDPLMTVAATVRPGGQFNVNVSNIPVGNTNDWIGLFARGAADSEFWSWQHLPQPQQMATASMTFTMPSTPGQYELRYFLGGPNHRLSVSDPITAGSQISVSATSVPSAPTGTPVTVTVSDAPAGSGHWVGLFDEAAPNTRFLAYQWMPAGQSSHNLTFAMPSATGAYNFRCFTSSSSSPFAVSAVVTVQPGVPFGVTSPAQQPDGTLWVAAGGPATVAVGSYSGATSLDWVGLYNVNGADNAYYSIQYLTAGGSRTFTMPTTPGRYQFRFFANNGWTRLAISPVVQVGLSTVTVSAPQVTRGGTVAVQVTKGTPNGTTDWVGMYASPNDPDSSHLGLQYVKYPSGGPWTSKVNFQLPGTVGRYHFRFFPNNSWTRIGTSPEVEVIGGHSRVTNVTMASGHASGAATGHSFEYTGFKLNSAGVEFRGHASVKARDLGNHSTTTFFKQDETYKGRVDRLEIRSAPPANTLIRQLTNTWSTFAPYPASTLVVLTRRDTTESEQGLSRTRRQDFAYDSWGNLRRVNDWGDIAVTGDERDEYTEWAVHEPSWIHRPKSLALHGAGGALIRETKLFYDQQAWGAINGPGLLTKEERIGAPASAITTVTYDPTNYGNRRTVTDPKGCTTTIEYDASGAHPISVKNCLDHLTVLTYNAKWGTRLTELDPNGALTTYQYDGFGRPTRTISPLDSAALPTVEMQYLGLGVPGTQRIRTARRLDSGAAPVVWKDEYFDGRGRVFATRSQGPNAADVVGTDQTFDIRGLVATSTAPYLVGSETPAQSSYQYDPLGRRTLVTHPNGKTIQTVYDRPGRVSVTDERSKVKRRTVDVHGRLTKVEEVTGGGTFVTTYAYDAAHALTTVTNHLGHVTAITYDRHGRKTQVNDPNMGQWNYGYDPAGNLTSQTDARTQTITFGYDAMSRPTSKTYPAGNPGGIQITWVYDELGVPNSKGRLTRVNDLNNSTTSFQYDVLGRVTQETRVVDGFTFTRAQTYNALGAVKTRTFPDNDTVTYTYNAGGALQSIPGYITGIAYNARAQRTQIQHANGVATTLGYEPLTFRPSTRVTVGPGGTVQNFTYQYDDAGNIEHIVDAIGSAERDFVYDDLNRLTQASGPFGGSTQTPITETYAYDAIGNFTQKAGVAYAYTDVAHPGRVSARTGPGVNVTYGYDNNGNTLTGDRTMTWDGDNRAATVRIQAATVGMIYDYTGRRLRKQIGGSLTIYPFPDYEQDAAGVVTKYLGGVAKKSTGAVLHYHDDHLGGVHVITNAAGQEVQRVEYDPWGRVSRSVGVGDPSRRFTGQRLDDPATGLYYYGARYYDAALGRFVSTDPIVPSPGNPQSLNRYAYVLNDPVNLTDPTGHFSIGKFFKKLFKAITKVIANADIEINVSSDSFSAGGRRAQVSEGRRSSPVLYEERPTRSERDREPDPTWRSSRVDSEEDETGGRHRAYDDRLYESVEAPRYWPTVERRVTQWPHAKHQSVDLANCLGCEVKAIVDGHVTGLHTSGTPGGADNFVEVRSGTGFTDVFSHTKAIQGLKMNDAVTAGQVIGHTDQSGVTRGPHLHYELRYGIRNINPMLRLGPMIHIWP